MSLIIDATASSTARDHVFLINVGIGTSPAHWTKMVPCCRQELNCDQCRTTVDIPLWPTCLHLEHTVALCGFLSAVLLWMLVERTDGSSAAWGNVLVSWMLGCGAGTMAGWLQTKTKTFSPYSST
jgi:hypothetical protein